MDESGKWEKEHWIISFSAFLLIIGAVLSWVDSYLDIGGVKSSVRSISGITTQIGFITGGCGIFIFLMFFFKKTPKIVSIILGSISFFISGLYFYYIKYVPKNILELRGSPGIGLILTIFASIFLIIGGILAKKNL